MNVMRAKGRIVHNLSLCSGCNACVDACSLYHFGECNPSLSAITLETYPTDDYNTPVQTCRQCLAPSCMAACPVEGAMYVDKETGARCIDRETCIGCGACADACPFNNQGKIVKHNPETNAYVKCNLCGGEPQCVRLCPMGALRFEER